MEVERKPVLAYSIKIRDKGYVNIALFPSDVVEHGSFLKVEMFDGERHIGLFVNKKEASFLAQMLQMLVDEGCKLDYEFLKKKYPNQVTWHIR
jgi:hypothetical protein